MKRIGTNSCQSDISGMELTIVEGFGLYLIPACSQVDMPLENPIHQCVDMCRLSRPLPNPVAAEGLRRFPY